MKRIAILGGTFDPFHNQHLKIAKTAYEKLKLDQVWILPTIQNPLKSQVSTTTNHRVAMINLAIKDYQWIKINDYELQTKDINYTINTIKHFLNIFPTTKFFFIIGADKLYHLEHWKEIDQLVKLIQLVVVNRPHFPKSLNLMKKYHCHNLVVHPSSAISSSKIRNGEIINTLDCKVNDYINDNLLYFQSRLNLNLTAKRYQHCLNVSNMAIKLAKTHGVNIKKAQIAGLFHDICKQWSSIKMKKYLSIHYPLGLKAPFPVWHAYVSAYYLQHHFKYHDQEIINAIFKHTTGAVTMSDLDLVVLLADKISIERNYLLVDKLRNLAFCDLKAAFKLYLQILKSKLEKKNQPLNQEFIKIYDAWNNDYQTTKTINIKSSKNND